MPMNCKEAVEHLLDFLEGGVGPDLRARIEKHVQSCKLCPELFQSYQKATSLCAKALRRDVPDDLVEKVMAAVVKERRASKKIE
jgi:hypothetical protein